MLSSCMGGVGASVVRSWPLLETKIEDIFASAASPNFGKVQYQIDVHVFLYDTKNTRTKSTEIDYTAVV